jgi:hypothetical protein
MLTTAGAAARLGGGRRLLMGVLPGGNDPRPLPPFTPPPPFMACIMEMGRPERRLSFVW